MEETWPAWHHTAGINRCERGRLPRPALGKQWEALPYGLARSGSSLPESSASLGQPWRARTWPTSAFSRTEAQTTADSSSPAHIFTWIGRIKPQIGVFLSSNGVTNWCGLFPEKKQTPVNYLQAFKTLKLRSSISQHMETKSWPNCAVGWFIFAFLFSSPQSPFPNFKHLSLVD